MLRSILPVAIIVLMGLGAMSRAAEASNCTWLKICVVKNGQKHCGKRKICRAGP